MLDDLRMALRSLLRRPGFTAVSVLTLALAAGANAAILAVVYGVLLKPLPSSRLMRGVVYGITPTDPLTYALIAATIVGIVVGASVMPAYRASRVDPLTALRSE